MTRYAWAGCAPSGRSGGRTRALTLKEGGSGLGRLLYCCARIQTVLCRTYGAPPLVAAYPGLTPWATIAGGFRFARQSPSPSQAQGQGPSGSLKMTGFRAD
jgi:hypothetical protein